MRFFLFPGQGSQTPGMGQDFYDSSPAAREAFNRAEATGPPGLLDTIFNGSAEALQDTRIAQVALLTVGVAIARHLQAAGHAPAGCAGHSVGELPALVAAGAGDFEEVFHLTEARAQLMSENVPEGGMAAVIGLPAAQIESALPAGVEVANYNGPQQTIISGSIAGLAEAEHTLKQAGAKRVMRLEVSGPFHSSYMRGAQDPYRNELDKVTFRPPQVRFISSVNAREVSNPEEIRELLLQQLCKPVRWTDVMRRIGPASALEVGPGRVLQGLAKRMEGAPRVTPVGTWEAANRLDGSA